MLDKEIVSILDKLEQNGFKAYIVGGFVRDFLLKKESKDIDIATSAKVKDLIEIFKEYNPISEGYGNVAMSISNYSFEITTFRKELSYKDNRFPDKIEYITSLEEDLKRRDFTVNCICMDKSGNIIDFLNAKKDLQKRIIKSVSNPYIKLEEDALRIMRAIRFATILNFRIDEELKKAIIKNKELLRNLSYDRKKEELIKIFTSEHKKYGIKLLKDLKLIDALELKNIDTALLTNDIIGIFASVMASKNYPFTRNEKDLIKEINDLMCEDLNDNYVLYKYGIYSLSIVCDLKKLNKKKIIEKYNKLPIKDRKEIKITSEEICEILNKKPGAFLKEMYNNIEMLIIRNELNNEYEDIKTYILSSTLVV